MLTCAFGTEWAWPHVCAACAAESDRLEALFWEGVKAGRWDRFGYTPNEAKRRAIKQLDLWESQ